MEGVINNEESEWTHDSFSIGPVELENYYTRLIGNDYDDELSAGNVVFRILEEQQSRESLLCLHFVILASVSYFSCNGYNDTRLSYKHYQRFHSVQGLK